jgi:hypothetical protein
MVYPMAVNLIALFSMRMFTHRTGLLIGAAVTQAPEGLFGVAISKGGVQDYLKVHVVNHSTTCV